MDFRTEIEQMSSSEKLSINQKIVTLGSCFSQSIGSRLQENKFDTLVNPFGTIYDPLSISRLLKMTLDGTLPSKASYIESQGVHRNLLFHSNLSGMSREELEMLIKGKMESTRSYLEEAQWLIITYGTAFNYHHHDSDLDVANCHKIPAANFSRKRLTIEEMTEDFDGLHKTLTAANPGLNIIVTVSPVRHLKDTLQGNSLSKASLRCLTDNISNRYANVSYYPSYEIILDDLRDYRFYKEDMIHPTDQAVDYIWEHFSKAYFSDDTKKFLSQWVSIKKSLAHRPFHSKSKNHQKFLEDLFKQVSGLADQVDVSRELAQIEKQLG